METIQEIKQRFFLFRNGIVSDSMRSKGAPYKVIFGLTLPQIREVAAEVAASAELAETLWANAGTRESVLLAPMVYPRDEMTPETALRWVASAPSAEAVDILCHSLLRRLDFATDLIGKLAGGESEIERYGAVRLAFNLLPGSKEIGRSVAEREVGRRSPMTYAVARQLLDEIAFLEEGL